MTAESHQNNGRPLPPIPEPPSFGPDPRQEAFFKEVGRLLDRCGEESEFETLSLTDWTGYPAASLDLGRVSDLVQRAFGDWSTAELENRWDDSVQPWIHHLLSVWAQRLQRREIRLLPGRVIELFLMTRDDRGDYSFHIRVDLTVQRRLAA